jgi:hypothetical protein
MSCQFLTALDAQNEVVQRRGVRQIIRVYGIDAGNQHHDNGVVWRTIDVYMFKDEGAHVLRYFKCAVGSSSSEGTAAEVTSTGTQSFSMNSEISGSSSSGGGRAPCITAVVPSSYKRSGPHTRGPPVSLAVPPAGPFRACSAGPSY